MIVLDGRIGRTERCGGTFSFDGHQLTRRSGLGQQIIGGVVQAAAHIGGVVTDGLRLLAFLPVLSAAGSKKQRYKNELMMD